MVHGDFKQSEAGSLSVGLGMDRQRLFADCAGSSILSLLWESRLWLLLLPLSFPQRAIDCASARTLDLDVLLDVEEDVPHLGNFVLHQVLVEGVDNLHPTNERRGSHVVIVVIHQS